MKHNWDVIVDAVVFVKDIWSFKYMLFLSELAMPLKIMCLGDDIEGESKHWQMIQPRFRNLFWINTSFLFCFLTLITEFFWLKRVDILVKGKQIQLLYDTIIWSFFFTMYYKKKRFEKHMKRENEDVQ